MNELIKNKIMKQRWERIEKESAEIVEVGFINEFDAFVGSEKVEFKSIERTFNPIENKLRARNAHVPVESR